MAESSGVDRARYVPALRFRSLTPFYDPVARWATRERTSKERLLDQAGLEPGQRILDVGCGTGTLLLAAKSRQPRVDAVGLDGDPEILARAREKAAEAGIEARFDEAMSFEMPYPDRSFDRVLSSLFFHHLTTADKERTLAEIRRVLKPGGELHVADFGRGSDPLMRAAFGAIRLIDGLEQTRANAAGKLPELFERAGLRDARAGTRLRTVFGTLTLYRACM
jgi:ubiquinone/menaquinone biosynthesis C-methylase UbiE